MNGCSGTHWARTVIDNFLTQMIHEAFGRNNPTIKLSAASNYPRIMNVLIIFLWDTKLDGLVIKGEKIFALMWFTSIEKVCMLIQQ